MKLLAILHGTSVHLIGAETATRLISLLKKASAHTDPCPTATSAWMLNSSTGLLWRGNA